MVCKITSNFDEPNISFINILHNQKFVLECKSSSKTAQCYTFKFINELVWL